MGIFGSSDNGASAAAAQARQQAAESRKEAEKQKRLQQKERSKAQKIMIRSLRARAGGFFENEKMSDNLGGDNQNLS